MAIAKDAESRTERIINPEQFNPLLARRCWHARFEVGSVVRFLLTDLVHLIGVDRIVVGAAAGKGHHGSCGDGDQDEGLKFSGWHVLSKRRRLPSGGRATC